MKQRSNSIPTFAFVFVVSLISFICATNSTSRTLPSQAPNNQKHRLLICGGKKYKKLTTKIFTQYVIDGKVDVMKVMALEGLSEKEKGERVLAMMEENNLPPFPKCRNRRPTFKAKTPKIDIDACVQRLMSDPGQVAFLESMMRSMVTATPSSDELKLTADKLKMALVKGLAPVKTLCAQPSSTLRNIVETTTSQTPIGGARINDSTGMDSQQMKQGMKILQMAIDMGEMPPNIFQLIGEGKVSVDDVKRNLTSNRKVMMSLLPPAIRKLAENGSLDEKYIRLFTSGKNESEMKRILMSDDGFFLQFFPPAIKDMLQNKTLPDWFKRESMKENNTVEYDLFHNFTMCVDVFGDVTCRLMAMDTDPVKKIIGRVVDAMMYALLVFIMFSMGLTVEYSKMMELVRRPKAVAIASVTQFVFMPTLATGIAYLLDLPTYGGLTILLLGCSPGGNLSNLLALLFEGDMNLSILMTSFSSVMALGFMPLNVFVWSRFLVKDSSLIIPYMKIFLGIVITLVPAFLGSLVRRYGSRKILQIVRKFSVYSLCAMSLLITGFSVFLLKDIAHLFPLKMLTACALLPMSGYLAGFLFSKLFRKDNKTSRTVMIETGCQNGQLCIGVLRLSFDPMSIGINFMVPIVYMFFQVSEIVIMWLFWKKLCKKNEGYRLGCSVDSKNSSRGDSLSLHHSVSTDGKLDENEAGIRNRGLEKLPQENKKTSAEQLEHLSNVASTNIN